MYLAALFLCYFVGLASKPSEAKIPIPLENKGLEWLKKLDLNHSIKGEKRNLALEYTSSDSRLSCLLYSFMLHDTWEFQVTTIWFLIGTPIEGRRWISVHCVVSGPVA